LRIRQIQRIGRAVRWNAGRGIEPKALPSAQATLSVQ
jgi:hypothetical protein